MRARAWLRAHSASAVAVLALFAAVGGIVWFNARTDRQQERAALVSNVAGRLRADVERYVADSALVANGEQADPDARLEVIRTTARALADGGEVASLQGGGETELPAARPSSRLRRKLDQQRILIDELAKAGVEVQRAQPGTAAYEAALLDLRVRGAQLSSVTGDVVAQISQDNQDALLRADRTQLLLALMASCAAVAVGMVFIREGRSREEARYRVLANNSSDLVTVSDEAGRVRYVSPSVVSILGRTVESVTASPFLDLVHPDDRDLVGAALGELQARPDVPVRVEHRMAHADGHWCVVESSWSNLGHERAVRGMVANTRDVSDRHVLEEELRRKAFLDDLTSLPNRALFGDRVDQAVQRANRVGGVVTVLFVDLDDFKTVNDSLGHSRGDRLLVAVGERIASCIRSTDTAARLGGDEFGILLSDGSTVDTAEALAARIIGALRDPFVDDERPLVITASVGIACQPAPGLVAEDLLRDADVAMYAAKSLGKGRYEVFADRMHREVVERQHLGSDLQQALARGELEVHYQPLVALDSQSVVGVEALLRWHHPTRGLVPPVTFIPIAEEIGLIAEIGAWVLEQACSQVVAWTARHAAVADLWVTVNLSPRQLADPRLQDDVARALDTSGIVPRSLVLEITEGALIGDTETIVAALHRLRGLGVRLAVDDFGTGYSSLSQLRMLPVDMLKIDKSFVDDTVDGGRGTALLHSIVDLGRVLDLEVVAEGIEDGDQAEVLRTSGSHLGQGFFFARPAAPADLEDLMAAGRVAAGAAELRS